MTGASFKSMPSITRLLLLVAAITLSPAIQARGDEPVVTVLADFEDESVAASIVDVTNVLAADCVARTEGIPARGRASLGITVGATRPGSAAACGLGFRAPVPIAGPRKVSAQAWINEGRAQVSFRWRDAGGRVFQTPSVVLQDVTRRWTRISVDSTPAQLTPVATNGAPAKPPQMPLEFDGIHVFYRDAGKQVVFLDDIEVEHTAAPLDTILARIVFDQPTHLYAPGATIAAQVQIENRSRTKMLPLTAVLSWYRADDSEMGTSRKSLNLQKSGVDFRSRQTVEDKLTIDEPGLYRLVARISMAGWPAPCTVVSTVAVTPSNRALSRGRSTFFGVQTNLAAESLDDQQLEIDVAREIGAQLVSLELPWRLIEPVKGRFDTSAVEPLVEAINKKNMACLVSLVDAPEWVAAADLSIESQQPVIEALAAKFGPRVAYYQPCPAARPSAADQPALEKIAAALASGAARVALIAPAHRMRDDRGGIVPLKAVDSPVGIMLESEGSAGQALVTLREFSNGAAWTWKPNHFWRHRGASRAAPGELPDAISVMKLFVEAARLGVGNVVWSDLRDDTADARYPDRMRGLVRRDYSPKTELLGFAGTVGMLNGLLYGGPLDGAPPGFDTALFLSGPRQVAVLVPPALAPLPAVLAPRADVPGTVTMLDFERRPLPRIETPAGPLTRPVARPMFLVLAASAAQESPKLSLARPWIRFPQVLGLDQAASVSIGLDASPDLGGKFLQLLTEPRGPITSPFSARELKDDLGKSIEVPIEFKRAEGAAAAGKPATATIRVSTTSGPLDFPLEIRPLDLVNPGKAAEPPREIGRLRAADDEKGDGLPIGVSYSADLLRLSIGLPATLPADTAAMVGVARQGGPALIEARATKLGEKVELAPLGSEPAAAAIAQWKVAVLSDKSGRKQLTVEIPATSLGQAPLAAGDTLLLAVRVQPGSERGRAAPTLLFGAGLTGNRSVEGYRWLKLGP